MDSDAISTAAIDKILSNKNAEKPLRKPIDAALNAAGMVGGGLLGAVSALPRMAINPVTQGIPVKL